MKESSAKQNEKESTWGFEVPRPDLRRISIDLRPNIHQQGNYSHTFRPSPGLDERPELQQLPPNYIIPFVSETPGRYRYHGGPIVDKSSCKWRATYLTRACGEIIGIEALNLPLPTHMSKIVRSVAVMASPRTCQSAIWIGPRLLLSTLHLQDWIQGYPSDVQCEHVRRSGMSFAVESEICSQFLSLESSKVQLVQFNTRAEIGIFKLQDGYLSSPDWVDIDWLMEGDEASSLNEGCQAACIAYNGRVTRQDEKEIKKQAWSRLQQNLPKSAFSVSFHRIVQKRQSLSFRSLPKSILKSSQSPR